MSLPPLPKVSVVMTTHNGRCEMCRRAIQSVINQTFTDWELVIVDDASSDGTDKMVKSFDDPRIKYIHRETNWGNDTRPKNEGIQAATAKYVCLLDSDNEFKPEHIEALYNEIESTKADVVYGDRWLIDDDAGKSLGIGSRGDFDYQRLMEQNYIDTSDVIIRRNLILKIGGFDERYRKYVDWNVWVRLAKYGAKFVHIPLVITTYHLHANMKSKTVADRGPNGETSVPLGNQTVRLKEWDSYDTEIVWQGVKPKVAIFSLTYDRLDYTKACFKSLYEKAGYPIDTHVIVDNGSKDGTVDWIKQYAQENNIELEVIEVQ